LAYPVHQYTQFVHRGRLYPVKANLPVGILGVDSVEIEHAEMHVKIIPGIPPFTPSRPAFGCSESLPAILSKHSRIAVSE
jgi:hypothetical protein